MQRLQGIQDLEGQEAAFAYSSPSAAENESSIELSQLSSIVPICLARRS